MTYRAGTSAALSGAGPYTISFTSAMPNTSYALNLTLEGTPQTVGSGNGDHPYLTITGKTNGGFTFVYASGSNAGTFSLAGLKVDYTAIGNQ